MTHFRPPAVPLITNDPYFSIWSFADELNEDLTRHWTGKQYPMNIGVAIDGEYYCVMGVGYIDSRRKKKAFKKLTQVSLKVEPLITEYEFKNEAVKVNLKFISPLLPDDLNIMSRPVSYIEYDVEVIDGKEHKTKFLFDIACECCVDSWEQEIVFGKTEFGLYCENKEQNVLGKAGDDIRIDWGRLHLVSENARPLDGVSKYPAEGCLKELDINKSYNAFNEFSCMGTESSESHGMVMLAYDDFKAIEYFGDKLDDFYKEELGSFEKMIEVSLLQYPLIKQRCIDFNEKLMSEARAVSEEYAQILALSYRQAVAAHKLVRDKEGRLLFISKECLSNGCAATLDITFPSMPLFLKYNPELVKGMLYPIFEVAKSKQWKDFEFAPHDAGLYPLVNGQVYGYEKDDADYILSRQMPIEECGNALIAAAAICKAENSIAFAKENKKLLKQWAEYLLKYGYDPKEQLCTDDFAGPMPRNCNLSIKAIVALAAYGRMFEEKEFLQTAKTMAEKWCKDAKNDEGTMLAFGRPDTWSIKYNMVWDKLLELDLFDEEVYKKEIENYKSKMNTYGVPMDSRADYTKLDWLAWTTVMTDDKEYTKTVYKTIMKFINETPSRVPLTDWYDTKTARQQNFQARSVVGALFINLL